MADEDDLNDDEDINDPHEGDGEEGEENGEDENGSDKKKLIIIIVAVLILLAGLGGGMFAMGMLDSVLSMVGGGTKSAEVKDDHGEKKDEHGKEESKKDKKKSKKGGHGEEGEGAGSGFVELPPMVVNLRTDEDDVPRYLRLTVQLELEDPLTKPDVEAILPRVVDQFQIYLRELHVRDLKGSAGIYRLQMELLWRVNEAAAPAEVKDILFQEILIQ